ncbi:bacillithiol biosynthesis cysteine-adding enzyme BshC [Xanthocytophaga agilis]|uniref:Putative cysteine ligase BshC n=1 Tax=Xanthocytophaga agilis TaxID=3048010 RepID=A0AAE3R221_9BACT|nr:bacillithiol biosynthesis cysteine-adding enzyme BshC [Xanthocytophaga agilis]MDJ1502304.1 bacillithiol biosynthesis cysteine-adding enzyme BshC [Xanthocytophaga agilis]
MTTQFLSLQQTNQFSSLFLDYIQQKNTLAPFYITFPTLDNFGKILQSRAFDVSKREALHQVLKEQYTGYSSDIVQKQIDSLLQPNTFTVTTGHQLNIFSGPLYVIYKLVTTINLAKQLQEKYPDYHFVPVYWMATEDHDFEEISYFNLFGKKYTWETTQTGAVGRMNPTEIQTVLDQLSDKFPIFEKAYLTYQTLADATRCWVTDLFGDQGLLCIDADHPTLKGEFRQIIKADVFDQVTQTVVNQTSEKLESLGYKTQVNARDSNFFYLDHGMRERIVHNHGRFRILNTELSFSKEEVAQMIDQHPERFSPNVLLRPIYQETILPNLAYIGGPAEVAYWLQLKDLFDKLGTPFPIVMPRNFALILNENTQKKLDKTGLTVADLFTDEVSLKRKYVEKTVGEPISLYTEIQDLTSLFDRVVQKAVTLDKSLEGFVGAEKQKAKTSLENIEKRLRKAEEQKQETGIQQVLTLKNKLFPGGSLQERTDNMLNFYANNPEFIHTLLQQFDPLRFEFQIITG